VTAAHDVRHTKRVKAAGRCVFRPRVNRAVPLEGPFGSSLSSKAAADPPPT
jgi:hypothetical protein